MKIKKEKKIELAQYLAAQFYLGQLKAVTHAEQICNILDNEDIRSPEQNRLYWSMLRVVADNTPENITVIIGEVTPEAWHEILKAKFNIKSTADLQKDEFCVYINNAAAWLAQNILKCDVSDLLGEARQ
jgi:hypothetical protein